MRTVKLTLAISVLVIYLSLGFMVGYYFTPETQATRISVPVTLETTAE